MTHSLYFTAAEGNVGTQALVRSLIEGLTQHYTSVGVFRAFTNGPIDQDLQLKEALNILGRPSDLDLAWGTTRQAYVADEEAAMADVVKRYTDYAHQFDAVLILGLLDGDPLNPGVLARIGRAAANLSTTIMFAVSGALRSADQLATLVSLSANEFTHEHAPISGVVVSNADAAIVAEAGIDNAIIFADGESVELSETGRSLLVSAMEHGSDVVTPLSFQSSLISRARADRKRIVLPEATDPRILQAADELLAREVADIILIGDADQIHAHAAELGVDVSQARIVSVDDPELNEKYAQEFARLRAKKGVTIEQAREKVKDLSYFGTMMVHMDDADGMVSGAIHTTAHTIVPSFQIIKTKPGATLVSSCFLMLMEDRVYVYGDCAVNTNPTPQELAGIAISSAETARAFGVDPRVAMLSYSTGTSGKGPDVDAVVEATAIAREMAPDLALEGPIQYDAAVDAHVAQTKLPDSPVAGKANVFVFPSLNAGNIGYKAVQRSAGAVAVGPVLQGLNKPVNDLSRGALVEDIVNTVAITAIQAQN
ncbi:phosphate acetyltransferase [Arcanobacterium pinnipediorum]|uniref:Phosphate acetyltransferase n=1 Tax=Arcanobacterium pinnipediorum TaxID=1503041 RepID=A0ABY5AFR3_9ACTO|nr:phosphate acetyltransferase [Arcanobacterium pinnipediorum]USR79039.1 phosphate acetyltransferase [Arcanobacterium pinnipediorum]